MDESGWKIISHNNVGGKKMEYVALRKITKEMTPAEKKGAELWNEMVEIVRSYGRMEDKK